MRQGEIFSLRWPDVDLENGLLNIQAFHTKTMKERQVAITTRLKLEFERLRADAPDNPAGLVFGISDNVKRSFTATRSKAGLNDVRFHDLRHTAATRLVGAHIPLSEVAASGPFTSRFTDEVFAASKFLSGFTLSTLGKLSRS